MTLPIAFSAAKQSESDGDTIDRLVRREAATVLRKQQVIPAMIESIKKVLKMEQQDGADRHSDP